MMTDSAQLRRLYDEQLRTDAETAGAQSVTTCGPLRLATFPGGRGFITYPPPGATGQPYGQLVIRALAHFRRDPAIVEVEWKTRGHDRTPGLPEALLGAGFVPGPTESIMIGPAARLAAKVALPVGVRLRRVSQESEVRAVSAMSDIGYGGAVSAARADDLLGRLAGATGLELWVAEVDGAPVGAGRLEPVAGSAVAGLWGGVVLPAWRGRGLYRALTAARARSALAQGKTLLHSDSTESSRPILERAGLVTVSTTTPYLWHPGPTDHDQR
jgi:GNAT superfamily N-acetyltransferase